MAYPQLEDYNVTEINQLMSYTSIVNPGYWPLVLFGFWMILMLGSYFSQKRTTGTGDLLASATVAGYMTTVLTTIMFLIPGVIPLYVLILVIVLTIVVTIIFLTSREKL